MLLQQQLLQQQLQQQQLLGGIPGGARGSMFLQQQLPGAFSGGAHSPQPTAPFGGYGVKRTKDDVLKEELEGVNRCVWQLYEDEQRRSGQGQPRVKESTRKPKTNKAERVMFSAGGELSELEEYLKPRLGFEETLFDPRVMQHVKKTYPAFYVKYPTFKAVSDARDKYRPVWRYS